MYKELTKNSSNSFLSPFTNETLIYIITLVTFVQNAIIPSYISLVTLPLAFLPASGPR